MCRFCTHTKSTKSIHTQRLSIFFWIYRRKLWNSQPTHWHTNKFSQSAKRLEPIGIIMGCIRATHFIQTIMRTCVMLDSAYNNARMHATIGRIHIVTRRIHRTRNPNERWNSSKVCCPNSVMNRYSIRISTKAQSNWTACNRWVKAVATKVFDTVTKKTRRRRRRLHRRTQCQMNIF